ncbi:hypothetical protein ACIRPK_36140 [Kitasatospora sp. NPDC101801]|uniref:hypothetical protein n=1 Tax=Kitasatospora sp. NPDC101801 TaxID=3364103 RepID=UPI003823DA90
MSPSAPRNIRAAMSRLAPTPALKVADQGAAAEPHTTALESARPNPARRPRGGKRPAPEATSAVALTVRVEPNEATAIDRWIIDLRDDARRTQLDKSEVIRELLILAREHEVNRPGFGRGSISCKDSSHGTSLFLPA